MRLEFTIIAVSALTAALAIPAHGQGSATPGARGYPNKPLRLVAPFPPGGSSDLIGRILGQGLTEAWGQQVIIDNRPGAAGNLGTALVAKSLPDGYTLLLGPISPLAINIYLYRNIGYDPLRDFAPVTLVGVAPTMLVTHPGVPAKSVQELINLARQKPRQLSCGSGGVGTPSHIGCEMLRVLARVELLHVPYKGTGQSINDLLGGQIHFVFASAPVAISHVRAGKLRVLAVTSPKRTPQAPEVPTLAEAGVPGYALEGWWGILVPGGTSHAIVEKLATELARIVGRPDVKQRFAGLGVDPYLLPPKEFAALIRTDIARFGKLVREAGIRAE